MINVNWDELLDGNAAVAARFRALPAHLAKKHLKASMRRAITASGGVKELRKNTPPIGTKRGRKAKGVKRSAGALRRAVTVKTKWIGRNKDGAMFAGLGYKYGTESLKAIWHEFGTTRMKATAMAQKTYESIKGKVKSQLAAELTKAIEKAAAELERNPGMSKRGRAAGL